MNESVQHFSEGAIKGCIQLTYDGQVASQGEEGKILGFEKGEKIMTIPCRIVKSVDPLNTVGY